MDSVPTLFRQGLVITALGMTLVFCALGLLWGLIALLTRVFKVAGVGGCEPEAPGGDLAAEAACTEERAQVAAIVAGAFMANALPMLVEPPAGPTFEDGRSAPSWVTARRAHTLRSWQPKRPSK